MRTDNAAVTEAPVDLTNCDREPIHIPGSIQPHGVLLTLHGEALTIVQASENTEALLGIAPTNLLQKPVNVLLSPAEVEAVETARTVSGLDANPLHLFTAPVQGRSFDAILHRIGEILVLELEPAPQGNDRPDMYTLVRRAVMRVQSAAALPEMLQATAEEIRRISGFDRVMIYQFDTDGHGSVVAEARSAAVEPFLGLHYPASDIPQQARRLYTLNMLRLIADVNYAPTLLTPAVDPTTNHPLDMSHCVLRSVSPIHVQYLKNMGVSSSMSVSLLHRGELWGLIACHHYSPYFVPYDTRTACEFLGQVISLQITARAETEAAADRARARDVLARLVELMAGDEAPQVALTQHDPTPLNLIDGGGAAICHGADIQSLGATPEPAELLRLIEWIAAAIGEEGVFATDRLSTLFPEAEAYKAIASGVLAVTVPPTQKYWALWFRPEVIQTVDWAGDPNKPAAIPSGEVPRLSPRGSFALWRETVQGRSLPWLPISLETAQEFRRVLVGKVLRQAEEIEKENIRLAQSNRELDAFAYIIAHDLKEPLRGIYNFSQFIKEDFGEAIGEEGRTELDRLAGLTTRMDSLLDSLLSYSRAGQLQLDSRPIDLNTLVYDLQIILKRRLDQSGTEVRIPRPLPALPCDEHQVEEVFTNLLSNAIKYNDKPQRWIEVGYLDETTPPVLYVRDNGIGIPEQHQESIFRIFKRLHGREEYGGGSGAGLTIARKVIERHGGRMWVTSEVGIGTTFYFTLAPEAAE